MGGPGTPREMLGRQGRSWDSRGNAGMQVEVLGRQGKSWDARGGPGTPGEGLGRWGGGLGHIKRCCETDNNQKAGDGDGLLSETAGDREQV